MGDRHTLLGVVLVGGIGILIVAGIYQLNKANSPVAPTGAQLANNTLGAVFK